MHDLGDELRIIRVVLKKVAALDIDRDACLEGPLKHCQSRIEGLLAFVQKADPEQYSKRRPRIWSQLKVVLSRTALQRWIAEMERSKSMLLQATNHLIMYDVSFRPGGRLSFPRSLVPVLSGRLTVDSSSQGDHTDCLQTIIQQTKNLYVEQQLNKAKIEDMHHTIDQIRDISSGLYTTTRDVITLMNQTKQLRQYVASGKGIQRTRGNGVVSHQNHSQQTTNHVFSTGSDRRIQNCSSTPSIDDLQRPPSDSYLLQYADDKPLVAKATHFQSKLTDRRLWNKVSSAGTSQNLVNNGLIGTVTLHTTIVSYVRKRPEGNVTHKKSVNTTISILPAEWLKLWGAILTYSRMEFLDLTTSQRVPHWTLTQVNVVSEESAIFSACRDHDIGAIFALFDRGLASPYDVDPHGRNLLGHVGYGLQVRMSHAISGML